MRLRSAFTTSFCLALFGATTLTRVADAEPNAGEPSARPVAGEPLEVTVKGSSKPESHLSAKPVTVVRDREIRATSMGSLGDVMRGRLGLSVQQTTPGQGTLYIRGLAGREVVYLVDGVRLNTAIFRSPNNASLGLVDPYAIFQAEAIRGPSSVLHGSDALGGAIVLHSTLPAYCDDPVTTFKAFEAVTVNPLGNVSRLSIAHQRASWSASLGLTYATFGDVTPGGNTLSPVPSSYVGLERAPGEAWAPALGRRQIGTGFTRLALDSVFRFKLGETGEAIVRAQLSDRPELVRYDEITPRFREDGKPARSESSIGPMYRAMTSLTLAHAAEAAPWDSAVLTFAWQRVADQLWRRNIDETCVTGGKADKCTSRLRLVPSASGTLERTRSDALSARGELKFLSKDRAHGAVVGVEAIRDLIGAEAWTIDVASGASKEAAARYPNGSVMTQAGAFAQLETTFFSTLRAHVGARGAFFALDLPERTNADPAMGGPALKRSLFDVALSAGLRFEPVDGLAWVMNAGRGVRSPNVEDYAGAGTRAGGRFQLPNPNLGPEHTHSLDAGVKLHRGLVRAETFLFWMRFDDAVGVTATTLAGKSKADDGTKYVTSANVQRLHLYGLESEVRIGHENKGGVYGRALFVGFEEKAVEGVTASERVATPPTLVFGSWIHPTPNIRIEVFAHGRGAMRRGARVDDNRIPKDGTDAFVTLHARASYRISSSMTARLAVDNATNVKALEYGSGYYLPGISVMAGLEARLSL